MWLSDNPGFRLAWRKRLVDHDGDGVSPGGVEKWLKAGGSDRRFPGCKRCAAKESCPPLVLAVDAYIQFVATHSHLEAVASSLTELFSPQTHSTAHGPPARVLSVAFLRPRLLHRTSPQAPEDADFGLAWVVKHARTRKEQDAAHNALRAKCDILWAHARRALFRLRHARLASPRRFSCRPGKDGAVSIDPNSRPQLAQAFASAKIKAKKCCSCPNEPFA